MPRPVSQTLEDLDILVEALRQNEQWRFDLVSERVAEDLGQAGRTGRIALRSDPRVMIELFRSLLDNAPTKPVDMPETEPPKGRHW